MILRRAILIGAGPIGLSAALGAMERGLDVTILEKGTVGDALRRWGSVRLFSPMVMNVTQRARRLLGSRLPQDDALMTGPQMADDVLAPLAETPPLAGRVRTDHRVIAVGRAGLTRPELAGHPLRAERPFRLLVETPQGQKRFEAEIVMDASGVLDTPSFVGAGGLPAFGELMAGSRIIRHLGVLEARRDRLRDRRVLLVGHGHSAANALLFLHGIALESTGTRVVWATRTANRRPVSEVADDPLPERQRVASSANDLAQDSPAWLTVERRAAIESLLPNEAGGESLLVRFSNGREQAFDEVVALTGYRPDHGFLSELALETSPVTEGAARLTRALSHVTDCLAVPEVAPADLQSGESGFFMIGAKSYGRSRAFLIRTGLAHVERILEMIR